ncbi:armadillo-type protein [Mycena sanguinolenta]|nr:armadillo-type protein [Mycena sanguinolenta]
MQQRLVDLQFGLDDTLQQQYGGMDSIYELNGLHGNVYNSYGFKSGGRAGANSTGTSSSTALYHHNGSRYGLGLPARTNSGAGDGKMNGLHGPKHKRSDMGHECKACSASTDSQERLEDLQGEIPALCKDQRGCRYLQKKLEEGSAEHEDMISRETFSHFADLMTDPFGNYFGNYLCTETLGADARYNAQIHLIIVALSLHVVVLIKDLNGNHVIKKCLNKLAPEDNQAWASVLLLIATAAASFSAASTMLRTINASGSSTRSRPGPELCRVRVAEHNTRKMLIEELLNRTRLEKLLRDSYGNYRVQTGLDYAEPTQCALLVEGIRPVLPLIRNTPDGKRIQNKLQREQMDHFGRGGYQHPQSLAPLGTQGVVPQGCHMSSGLYSNGLSDIYVGQGGLYGQSSFWQTHIGRHHSLGPSSIDSYVLQGNSSHIGLTSSHHAGGLSGAPSAGISPFGRAGFTTSLSGDPYQRSFGGYGM